MAKSFKEIGKKAEALIEQGKEAEIRKWLEELKGEAEDES